MNSDLEEIFDNLPEGVVLFNKNFDKLGLVNKEFKKLFEIIGHSSFAGDLNDNDEEQDLMQSCLHSPCLVDF